MNDNQKTFLPLTSKHIVPIQKSFVVFNYFHLPSKHRNKNQNNFDFQDETSVRLSVFILETTGGVEEGKLKVGGLKGFHYWDKQT